MWDVDRHVADTTPVCIKSIRSSVIRSWSHRLVTYQAHSTLIRPYLSRTYWLVPRPSFPGSRCFIKLLLGRVALGAQRPIVIKLSREWSVGLCVDASVCASVCPVHCGKTENRIRMPFGIVGRTDPGMRQVSVHGKGYFWEQIWGRAIVTNGDFTAYVCDSAATPPSSQITLGRLVTLSPSMARLREALF